MIVDGKKIAEEIIARLPSGKGKSVCFIQFGENKASEQFIEVKTALAIKQGIMVHTHINTDAKATQEIVNVVQKLVAHTYDGIVVQLPLPPGVDVQAVLDAVPVEKDIDVLSTAAKDAFIQKKLDRMPPVAGAIAAIFSHHDISVSGKKIVILGKGRLVGAPVSLWLERQGIIHDVVTIHTPVEEKLALLKNADIIISGTGKSASVTADMIKDSAVLIDAGTSEQAGKLVGDIDPACADKAMLYTPVPGGVGPVTVACLFQNLFQ